MAANGDRIYPVNVPRSQANFADRSKLCHTIDLDQSPEFENKLQGFQPRILSPLRAF